MVLELYRVVVEHRNIEGEKAYERRLERWVAQKHALDAVYEEPRPGPLTASRLVAVQPGFGMEMLVRAAHLALKAVIGDPLNTEDAEHHQAVVWSVEWVESVTVEGL